MFEGDWWGWTPYLPAADDAKRFHSCTDGYQSYLERGEECWHCTPVIVERAE